jgi:UDP-2-acetamido-3-amino-2,3-dideoxy-glucuronate N-acetyltransferase
VVRVGVAGTGYWGRNLVRNFANIGALAAICDVDPTALGNLSEQYPDATPYTAFKDLLGDAAVDAVVISTPAVTHGALARQALEAGKHVFVEKPLCLDLEEAAALGALATSRGLTLMVGHLLLYHPAFVALEAFVNEGRVGNLRYIYSNRASLGKIRKEENALWSFAPHDISMILQLAGEMPKTVTCVGGAWLKPGVADTTLSHLAFKNNVQAHIFVSWLHPFKDHRLVVVGEYGMAVFNDVESGSSKLLHYPHAIGWEGEVPTIDKAQATPIVWQESEPLACECLHFIDCVENGKEPRSNAAEGRSVLVVLDACQRALNLGQNITLTDEI